MFINHTKPGVYTFKYSAYNEIKHYSGHGRKPEQCRKVKTYRNRSVGISH